MGPLQKIEDKLNPVFTKSSPVQLPENAKKWIVKYSPIIGLVIGILGLIAALSLWNAAHTVSSLVNYTNEISKAYGTGETVKNVGITFYLSFFSLLVFSVIPIIAYPGLKARSKSRGWNLLFISALVSFIYGIFNAIYYGAFLNIISATIGAVISLFIVFQIRSYYSDSKKTDKTT